jgi:rhodanese-related sulfurtransferase
MAVGRASSHMNETVDAPQRAKSNDAEAEAERILDIARTRLEATEGAYAGAVTPSEAWQLYKEGRARLIDVRTAPEVRYVGCVPGALHVEWHGTDAEQVRRFLHDLKVVAQPDETVLLLCRSGVRSHHAARIAHDAGYLNTFNVLEGFEGQRNHSHQRGLIDGWRSHGLPWIQD